MAAKNSPDGSKTVFVSGDAVASASQSGSHAQSKDPPWLSKDWSGPKDVFGPSIEPFESGENIRNSFTGTAFGIADGTVIGQYELIRQLGRGGMGVVYLARDSKLGRRVAIKFLQFNHPEMTRRFIVEAKATARCTHENIVVIHEVGEHSGSPFMVLEYVDGQPLSDLRSAMPLPLTRAVEIMVAVVRALARAHEEGIVHRDLKPENILISNAGAIKVLDFGIAKLLERKPNQAEAPTSLRRHTLNPFMQDAQKTGLVGTMAYMSPEQWIEGGEVDYRTDIWTVGVILSELLTGKNPLDQFGDDLPVWVTRTDISMPSLGNVAPQLPSDLIRLVDTCLRKDRDERFSSALDLLRALEPFLPGRYQAGQAQVETGPYAGLRAFQEEDAGRFFGRSTELAEMLSRLRETPLMAAVGPSGVGKSSFLRAGVLPALRSAGEDWLVIVIRPGRHAMLALAGLCLPLMDQRTVDPRSGAAEHSVRARLITEAGYFGTVLRDHCRRNRQRIFLLVDQFEELYTLGTHVLERRAFTASLTGAADDAGSPIRIVLTLRADFLGRIAEDAQFMNELRGGLFFLGPPTSDGLRDALVRPAEGLGYRFETNAMVNEMVQFLEASPNGLPLLQFAASQLWENRDPVRHLLTENSYRGIGGVAGALVSHADRVITTLSLGRQAICRSLFVHLVTPERTRAVRSVKELVELIGEEEELRSLIDELVDSRLLVVQTLGEGASVEIVHESLIMTWPTLRRWLDASHEDSLFLDQLLNASRHWDANHRASGLLWSGEMVDELKRFQRRYKGKLPVVADEFVVAIGRQATRRKRIKQGLVVGGILTTAGLLTAAAVALVVISSSRAKAIENEQRAVAAQTAAQDRLDQVIAEKKRTAEAKESTRRVEGVVEEQNKQLKSQNLVLENALKVAEQQRTRAEEAKKDAEESMRLAEVAKLDAERAKERERRLKVEAEKRAEAAAKRHGILASDLPR